jgi:hypothetical protein
MRVSGRALARNGDNPTEGQYKATVAYISVYGLHLFTKKGKDEFIFSFLELYKFRDLLI